MFETEFVEELLKFLPAILIAILISILAGTTYHYYGEVQKAKITIALMKHDNEIQDDEATTEYNKAIADRDSKVKQLADLTKQQDTKDAQTQDQINKLNATIKSNSIRVHIKQSTTDRSSSSNTTNPQTASTSISPTDATETSGILSDEATRSIAEVIGEMETENAAFASCRAYALTP